MKYGRFENTIREQDPLKQGLKLRKVFPNNTCVTIREQDPLKQGLKPELENCTENCTVNSRARSIKTRIETS